MRMNFVNGVFTPALDKTEVIRIKEGTYLLRYLASEIAKTAPKGAEKLTAAIDVVDEAVKTFGGKHLQADGTVIPTQRDKTRDPSEAKGAKKGGSGP